MSSQPESNSATQQQQPTATPTPTPTPTTFASAIKDYFNKATEDYLQLVTDLAKRNEFVVHVGVPSGKKVTDPITGEKVDLFDKFEVVEVTRRKINQRDWKNLEVLRGREQKEQDPERKSELTALISECSSLYFLGLTKDQWLRADVEELKPVLEACMFRTQYSLPYSPRG
jgi:hypothetical protein